MAKKEKKISVNELEKAAGNIHDVWHDVEWNGISFKVKHSLSLEEMMLFVHMAVEMCFGDGDEYRPELDDFAIRLNVIDRYTNLRLPENTEKKYEILISTDLVDVITQNINRDQFDNILESFNKRIRDRVQTRNNTLRERTDELIHSIESAVNTFGDIFRDVDSEKMNAIVSALATKDVDEGKIMNAYLNAKQDGDV